MDLAAREGRWDNQSGLQFGVQKSRKLKGLILAQNERWRRGLGMQVERERVKPARVDP